MKTYPRKSGKKSAQDGASLLVVLVLLTVMLLSVVSLARMGEASTLIAGNIATKDAALQASEVGVADAYAAIQARATADFDADDAAWYRATYLRANDDATSGLPGAAVVDWSSSALNSKAVGGYTVRYVVERMCAATPVTDVNHQCMVKKAYAGNSGKAGTEDLESEPGMQYRVTVNVAGPRSSSTFVQAFVVN